MSGKVDLDAINWSNFSPEVIRHVEEALGLRPKTPRREKRAGQSAVDVVEEHMTAQEIVDYRRRKAKKGCFLTGA